MLYPSMSSINVDWHNPDSAKYAAKRVSARFPSPSPQDLNRPVVIFAHGFGASPFEWVEAQNFLEQHSSALVSNIYLGGHDSMQVFSSSLWQDWLQPISDEYNRLIELGFTSLYLVGGSTGATLMLTALLEGSFSSLKPLKHLILVDTLVSPNNKTLYALPYLRWFYCKQTVPLSAEEEGHWLPQRPTHALLELLSLIKHINKQLQTHINIPDSLNISIFYSSDDPVVNPKSSIQIHDALSKNRLQASIHKINSNKHVFPRLLGRKNTTNQDKKTQQHFFSLLKDYIHSAHPCSE